MNAALEYILKLTDMLSPGMRQAAAVADTQGAKIQADINKVSATAQGLSAANFGNKLASEFNAPIAKVKELGIEIDKVKNRSAGGSLLGGLFKMAAPLAAAAGIADIVAGGIGLAGSSVDKAMEYGSTKQSFQVLTGSKDKGNALAGDLNKLQQDTILGPEVFKNAQTMMGFGIGAEKVIPTLKMLGDVSMGNAEKMGSLTLAYSQVQAAGRLTGQDLLQFINAGFNPLNEISKQTGLSIGELKTKMEQGAISSDMVSAAFQRATSEGGLYNNMMNKLAETPAGKLAQLEGAFEGFKIKLGDAFMPLASVGMTALTNILGMAQDVLPYITNAVQFLIDGFNNMLSPTSEWAFWINWVKEYVGIIWNGLKNVLGSVFHIIGGIIEWMGKSQIIQDIFSVIKTVAGFVWDIISGIASVLSWIWDNVIKPVLDAIDWVYGKIKSLLGFVTDKPLEVAANVTTNMPAIPGVGTAAPVTPATANAPGNNSFNIGEKDKGSSRAEGINSGGQRSLVINIGKMSGVEQLHVMNSQEAVTEIEAAVTEVVRRMIYSMNGVAAN